MTDRAIIIGASHTASQLCVSLRQGGWSGEIIVIGDEAVPPYHRPPLSKDFLLGNRSIDDILIRPAQSYADANIELRLGERVTKINRDAKTVTLANGDSLSYTKLVVATGARIRKLPIPGADLPHVFYLRDSADVEAIRVSTANAKNAVVIGGGYIGLETAASLRKLGLNVTVLEAMSRILQRVTSPELSSFFRRLHTEEGTNILEEVMASKISKSGNALSVKTKCGQEFPADIVVIGIGVIPNTELAEAANLKVGNGIEVNEYCQTNDPDIYAAGDVSWYYNPIYARHMRLESVPNTTEQAKVTAAHINGKETPLNALPWFWSDQYDVKLQIAGLIEGYTDIVLRGDIDKGCEFAIFYFKDDVLLAVDAVNSPQSFMMGKMTLTKGKTLDKAIVADVNAPLKSALI